MSRAFFPYYFAWFSVFTMLLNQPSALKTERIKTIGGFGFLLLPSSLLSLSLSLWGWGL